MCRAVERAVAQHDPLRPPRTENRLLEVTDRGHRLAELARGRRVQRVLLGLDRPAGARVRAIGRFPCATNRCTPYRLPGREQMVGPLGPQPFVNANERSK